MKLILRYIRRHLGMFLTAILFLCVEIAADLLQPTFMANVVDRGVKGKDAAQILRYGGIMLAIAAAGAFGVVMRNIFASRTSQLIGGELRSDIYRKVQSLSFENIDRLQPSSIITRITSDVSQIEEFIRSIMRIATKAPITCAGAMALVIVQTPKEAPMVAAVFCISAVLILLNIRYGYPRFGALQRALDRLNGVSREFLASIRVVKAFGAERQEEEKFGAASADLARAGVSAQRVTAVFTPLISLAVNFGIVVLLWTTGTGRAGEIGRLMASVSYMTQILFSLSRMSRIMNAAARASASSARVEEVLRETPAQAVPAEPLRFGVSGGVELRGVSFAYAGSSRASLTDVSFAASPGETIGIIGPTGSGKTTLVNLVPRFYDATAGSVLVDGRDVTRIDGAVLRGAVAVAPQKALLFSGTVAENIRWGDPGAPEEAVRAAARTACADGFVSALPQGYDTLLGQGGVNLSGGQKQRLSIARALLRGPRILILDDCTSALDASTEAEVLRGIREAAAGMTVLLISQRVSTVMRADRILCLEDGQVRGFGTHGELMASCPEYRAIYASQIGGGADE